MYFGVDYYPEHWPEERWPLDAKMMNEANINVVRLAEFAWAKMEPEEGLYDFAWLDRAIGVLAGQGIKVVLGTPTAAAPKWLLDKYPEIYPVDFHGLTKGFGTRRHYCPTNPTYREYSKKIAKKMAEHYHDNKDVIAWQIDNEFGGQCCCESCRKGFVTWLKTKYGSLDMLNKEWGTIFWSQTYTDWSQIILPKYTACDGFAQNAGDSKIPSTPFNHNPGLLLDFYRFSSDALVDFQRIQIDEIRKKSDLPITHNFMGHYSETDYFNLAKDIDFVSWDVYPNNMWAKSSLSSVAMAHDLMRGLKRQNFWIMEQQSGPCGWQFMGDTPQPGQIRLWTYQSIAHGADAIVYFRWRACTVGTEQYWYGILDHDGVGRRRYREVKQIGEELKFLSNLFVGAENKNEVALVKSYDNFWSHRAQPHTEDFDYNNLLQFYYDALIGNHINTDVISIESDLSQYKFVLMPAFNLMTGDIGKKCEEYVENGGTLMVTFRSGTKTWNNSMDTQTYPGYFKEMAGVELEEFDCIRHGKNVKVYGEFGSGTAQMWCDVLKANTAKVIAQYENCFYAGTPAVTVNIFGKGKVYYAACDLDEEAMYRLMRYVAEHEGLTKNLEYKLPGVEAVRRNKDGQEYLMLLNHNEYNVEVSLEGSYADAVSGRTAEGSLELEAYGVAIIKISSI